MHGAGRYIENSHGYRSTFQQQQQKKKYNQQRKKPLFWSSESLEIFFIFLSSFYISLLTAIVRFAVTQAVHFSLSRALFFSFHTPLNLLSTTVLAYQKECREKKEKKSVGCRRSQGRS